MAKVKVVKGKVVSGAGRAIDLGGVLDTIKYARFIPVVISIVSAIQVLRGPGDGPSKKAAALAIVASALALYEGILEKDAVNDAEFIALADELIELGVTLMKLQPRVETVAARIRGLNPKTT